MEGNKLYITTLEGIKRIAGFVKQCNPPEGMSKEEMRNKFLEILIEIKR